jgi:hypothetical protein
MYANGAKSFGKLTLAHPAYKFPSFMKPKGSVRFLQRIGVFITFPRLAVILKAAGYNKL